MNEVVGGIFLCMSRLDLVSEVLGDILGLLDVLGGESHYWLPPAGTSMVRRPTHAEEDPAHNLIHTAISIFGSGTVVIALLLGGAVMWKKFAKKWFAK